MMIEFASIAVSNFDWGNYETVQGSANRIPQALCSLLDASLAQADSYYWEIENQVVVQGQLFSAAEPTLQVLSHPFWIQGLNTQKSMCGN
jgi:hypothetical protein